MPFSLSRHALALLLAVASAPAAAAPTVDQVVSGVESAYKDVRTLQADFSQVVSSATMGAGPAQTGVIKLARPRKMRWDFVTPDDKLFVTDGATMWVYTPADKQVFISEDLGGGDGNVEQLLDSLDKLDELFEVRLLEPASPQSVRLDLRPRAATAQFKSLELELSADGYRLQRLVLVDAFDTRTELAFSNLVLNPSLPDAAFTFQVPDGIAVIRSDGL